MRRLNEIVTFKNENDCSCRLELRIREVVLNLLESSIFPDSSKENIRAIYGKFVINIKEIKSFGNIKLDALLCQT